MDEDNSVKHTIKLEQVSVSIGSREVLAPITLDLAAGTKLGIAGETGSGKSTLLKAMAGLQNLAAGRVLFNGNKLEEPWEKLIPGHPAIAYLSQHFELRNNYRVGDLLSYAEKLDEEKAQEIYTYCQVAHLLGRKTDQLSGGEKQRIALARLLVAAPSLVLLDEPFSNLDSIHKTTMKQVLHDLGNAMAINWVLVSHEPADLLSWSDELMVMKDGKVEQVGKPEQVFFEPVNEYVAGMLGPYSIVPPVLREQLGSAARQGNSFVRPVCLQLTAVGPGLVTGIIKRCQFIGTGYLIEVLCKSNYTIIVLEHKPYAVEISVGIRWR